MRGYFRVGKSRVMSTLAEIEAVLPDLSGEELGALERRLHELRSSHGAAPKIFTGLDAVLWWNEIEHLPLEEAEAFARDVEAGRAEVNRPPVAPGWE